MIGKHFIKLWMMLMLTSCFSSAFSQPYREGDNFRLGVTMGLNTTRITGSELASPTNKFGMAIGAYYRTNLSDNLQIKAELAFSLRGGKFDFSAENHYNQIKFTYMDLPIELFINTSGSEANEFLTLGIEPSYLLQSEIYVNPSFRPRYQNFGFNRLDLAAVLGYHFDFYYLGIQPSLKIGLLDINNQINMVGVLPETGKNQNIRNLTFDVKVFF
jgi:hypothetical protein